MAASATRLQILPLTASFAAEITGTDLARDINDEGVAAELRRVWLRHGVLRFRGQALSDPELLRFSRIFGTLDGAPITTSGDLDLPAFPEIAVISNIIESGRALGALGSYESDWHTDMSYKEECPSASILYALEVPPHGGNTSFADMHAAYDSLPSDLKAAIAGRLCKHDSSRNSAGELRKGFAEVVNPADAPGAVHPLVRTHPETRRPALFLGRRRNAYVMGLPLAESETLLDRLWAHAIRPELCWTQVWKVGDLIMWDNRRVMHRRDALDERHRRLLHRTQVKGDRPFFVSA